MYIIYILYFVVVIIFFELLNELIYKKIVGKAGEHHVKKELNKLPKEKYLILNDIMLQVDSKTYQIDHIVVSEYGIFVIETKQWNGYIVGNEYDAKWKQNKRYITNPIRQNYGHVKALESLLSLDSDKFIPIVCIPSRAKVRVKAKSYVLRIYELNKAILSYNEKKLDDYKDIYITIEQANITEKEARKNHIKYAQEVKDSKKNTCPKCGGELVKRNGKHGDFLGCSNYPNCKFTQKYTK